MDVNNVSIEPVSFAIGECFGTYEDLQTKIEKFKEANFVELYIRDSRTVQNKRNKKNIKKDLKYSEIKYACVHGGRKHKSRGKGVRNCP